MDKKNKKVFIQPHDDFQRELEEIYNKIKGVKDDNKSTNKKI